MRGRQKFFICKKCGNIVGVIQTDGTPLVCCNEPMTELIPNTVEASTEKHLPAVTVSGDRIDVQIGSVPHPMEAEHSITFVYLETERGGQRKCLNVGEAPKQSFVLSDDKPVAVFAYCNLHGLWKTEL